MITFTARVIMTHFLRKNLGLVRCFHLAYGYYTTKDEPLKILCWFFAYVGAEYLQRLIDILYEVWYNYSAGFDLVY